MTPSKFDDLIGHVPQAAALRQQIADGTLAHALLVVGPPSIGKTTFAVAAAALLLDAVAWPGGVAAHPDLWIEDSADEIVKIDRIQAGASAEEPSLLDFLTRRAYAGGRRVAIIARAERLNDYAANALLKTIEEPPDATHIILCSGNADALPATILSRCQTINLAPLTPPMLAAWLVDHHQVAAELAATAAALSLGRPGRALRLATETGALATELDALDAFVAVAGGGVSGALAAAAALAPAASGAGREAALAQLGTWMTFLRDVVLTLEGVPELITWSAYARVIEAWADALTHQRALGFLEAAINASVAISANAQPRLAYDVLFIEVFGGIGGAAPPKSSPVLRTGALAGLSAAPPRAAAAASAGTKRKR